MVGAIFFTDTDHGGHDYFYKGEDANDLITQFNEDQNLLRILHRIQRKSGRVSQLED